MAGSTATAVTGANAVGPHAQWKVVTMRTNKESTTFNFIIMLVIVLAIPIVFWLLTGQDGTQPNILREILRLLGI